MAPRVGRVGAANLPTGSQHATHAGVEAGQAARFGAALDRAKADGATSAHERDGADKDEAKEVGDDRPEPLRRDRG